MAVQKMTFTDLAAGNKSPALTPDVPKNFSFFGKKPEEEAEFTKTQLESKQHQAKQEGFNEGKQQGFSEATSNAVAIEQSTRATIENIAAQLTGFLAEYEEQKKNFMRDMVRVTLVAIKMLSEKLIKENTEEVLMQALERSSHIFTKQPQITLRAKKIILEKITDRVDNIIKGKDIKGSVTYVADDSVAEGSCVLEWAESGISINSAETMKQVEETLSEYLKSI